MPTGLVVNELMTNALKHAFAGREAGTVRLECAAEDDEWRVVVADNGLGLPEGVTWPQPGKMGAMMARALEQNAHGELEVVSRPGEGMRVTIRFPRK
jgi:two-component sensor histidine kinase